MTKFTDEELKIWMGQDDSDDVLLRFVNQEDGYKVTVVTYDDADEDISCVQMSQDEIIVIINGDFVQRTINDAQELHGGRLSHHAAGAIGFSAIVVMAMEAAQEKFEDSDH